MTQWAGQQAKTILEDARRRYGPAWDLMSQDQRSNYLLARLLLLVTSQVGPQFEPAIDLVRKVQRELDARAGGA